MFILISTCHYSNFFIIHLGKEMFAEGFFLTLILRFMTQKLTKFAESICAIWSVLKYFAEFYFCDWLLHLLDFYYRLIPDWLLHLLDFYYRLIPNSFSKKLIFTRKASTHFLKLSRKIFHYFSKISAKFLKSSANFARHFTCCCYFRNRFNWNKVFSVPPENAFLPLNIFAKTSIVDVRLVSKYASELSLKHFSQL